MRRSAHSLPLIVLALVTACPSPGPDGGLPSPIADAGDGGQVDAGPEEPACGETVEGDVVVDSAAALAALEGTSHITGALTISFVDGLQDLTPLACLTHVDEMLTIAYNVNLTSLDGLGALEHAGALWLAENGGLDLIELPALTSAPGGITVEFEYSAASLLLPALSDASALSIYSTPIATLGPFVALTQLDLLALDDMTELTDLSAFSSVTSLRSLYLGYLPGLTSLTGLDGVNVIENLQLEGNDQLASLAGPTWPSALFGIELYDNPALTDLSALDGVTTLHSLTIRGWPGSTFDAFPELAELNFMTLEGNETLATFAVHESIVSMHSITVRRNPALASLSFPAVASLESGLLVSGSAIVSTAFPALITVGSAVDIHDTGLADLSGFDSIRTIGDDLFITENAVLTDVTALHDLVSLSATFGDPRLVIRDNPQLSPDDAQALADALVASGAFSGEIAVEGNGS